MKNSIPISWERESEAFIRGNGREREFPLTTEQQLNASLINHQLSNSFHCDMKRRHATMLFVFAPWIYNKRNIWSYANYIEPLYGWVGGVELCSFVKSQSHATFLGSSKTL